MPEIKKQFTKGKMNKDLDERLVPNGEYRDAMNIQVATSEDGDVATVQNILGNDKIDIITKFGSFIFPTSARVIGSVADEKVDTLYWFVWSPEIDYILSFDRNTATPTFVFVDVNKNALRFDENNIITGINVIDGMIFWTDNKTEPKKLNIKRCTDGTTAPSNGVPSTIINATQTKLINDSTSLTSIGGPTSTNGVDMEEKHLTVIKKAPPKPMGMDLIGVRDNNLIYTGVITVEIDDDAINDSSLNFNGNLNVQTQNQSDIYNFAGAQVGDVYAIKIEEGIDSTGAIVPLGDIRFSSDPNNPAYNGQSDDGLTGWHTGTGNATIQPGTKLVIQRFDAVDDPPGIPITDFAIKGQVVDRDSSTSSSPTHSNAIYFEITNITGFPPEPDASIGEESLQLAIDLFDETEKLFEFKFPRFSYRYKYEDGEYSPFAPFTQVAFAPGSFDYHPRKGYNIGMTNTIRTIKLNRFLNKSMPQDIVAVDILFKDEPSTAIYVVDTLTPKDHSLDPSGLNKWDVVRLGGDYVIEKETVNQILPSNQLLRPWDNVPRKALAQDITGNRIVYANYVQNYDMLALSGEKYYPEFKTAWKYFPSVVSESNKSCKSLREYQLGVVFIDKYGRETPVISNPTGTMKLDKTAADTPNRIQVGLRGNNNNEPQDMTYFKFFVKETANEYYNLAMDRWYYAEDDNVWLSFPSTERNKIDLDTFLILKKGSDQDILVEEAARYKILAIESEAPDFIKTKALLYSEITHFYPSNPDSSGVFQTPGSPLFEANLDDAPLQGRKEFKILYNLYKNSPGKDLHNYLATGKGELYIEFANRFEEEVSQRYKIANITSTYEGDTSTLLEDTFNIQLEKPLGSDVNFITTDPTGLDPEEIIDGTIVRFYKYEVLNLAQFDGRFFVKIFMDDVFRQNIEKSFKTELGFRIVEQEKIYYLKEDWFEQFTQYMNWWFTPNYQEGPRSNGFGYGGYGSTKYRGSRLHSGSEAYGYSDVGPTSDSGTKFFGDIIQLLYFGPPQLQTYDTNTPTPGVSVGGDHSTNTDDDGNLRKFGHYGNDKFCASALYFRRFKPMRSLKGTSANPSDYNLNYQYCTYNGGGDKRDPDNWSPISFNQSEAANGIGSHWVWYDYDGSGYREAIKEGTSLDVYDDQDNLDACRDAEVWFIDNGRVQGLRTTNNSLQFNQSELSWSPIHINNSSCNKSGKAGGPIGIQKKGDKFNISIGYGGIYGMQATYHYNFSDFFGIGGWNGNAINPYHDSGSLSNFVQRINPGYRFKFAEDPTKTVYTVGPNIREKNYLNHSTRQGKNNLDGAKSGIMIKHHQSERMWKNMDPAISHNFRKNWRVSDVKPGIVWNPLQNGEITGGVKINLTICNASGSTSNTSNVTSGNPNGPDGDDVKIYVSSLNGTDATHGVQTLHEGMALKKFERISDSSSSLGGVIKTISGYNSSGIVHKGNDFLVVREITPKPNSLNPEYYELKLGGYNMPMNSDDHSWLESSGSTTSPKVGGLYQFVQVGMNGHNSNTEFNINTCGYELESTIHGDRIGKIGAVGYNIQFVEEIQPEEILSENPAIWETEPKDSKDLEIYYEATGAIPFNFDETTVHEAFPIGSSITTKSGAPTEILYVTGYMQEQIVLNQVNITAIDDPSTPVDETLGVPVIATQFFNAGAIYQVTTPSGLNFGVEVTAVSNSNRITIDPRLYNANFRLPWFNCYSFGNGVESNRIRDNYNQPFILNGVKASTTLEQEYKEERRQYGLIYSGIYNSVSGVNDLNQFIQAEKITKDINPIYGSIQKLHSRDSDLVTLCEDKVLKIQANKDALFNADGNTNVTASSNVLGQAIPFSGEYGISTNPESFASEDYRVYFSDKVRGKVLRLSKDGLTAISDHGMTDWFKDNLKLVRDLKILGSYDDRNDEYNIKLQTKENATDTQPVNKVLTFSEKVKGWVSFKSFVEMENAISMGNDYYSFFEGNIFKHYSETQDRNTFYNNFVESSIDVMLNDNPAAVKVFNTLNYEGSQSKVDKFINQIDGTLDLDFQPITTYTNQEYYNLNDKDGWYVEDITTNKERGTVYEFLEKEGKWFNSINKFVDISIQKADAADFTFQGVGIVGAQGSVLTGTGGIQCPVPTIQIAQQNGGTGLSIQLPASVPLSNVLPGYDSYTFIITPPAGSIITGSTGTLPIISDAEVLSAGSGTWTLEVNFIWTGLTSCISIATVDVILGCTDTQSSNYNINANYDNGTCAIEYGGCTDINALNYDPNASFDDGTCIYVGPADDDITLGGASIDLGDTGTSTDDDVIIVAEDKSSKTKEVSSSTTTIQSSITPSVEEEAPAPVTRTRTRTRRSGY